MQGAELKETGLLFVGFTFWGPGQPSLAGRTRGSVQQRPARHPWATGTAGQGHRGAALTGRRDSRLENRCTQGVKKTTGSG